MPRSRRRVGSFWRGGTPRLIAHRGYAPEGVPQNSITAFRRALDEGATHLESDVRATSDGIAVLCHDPDLSSHGISGVVVAETTLTALQSIDIGGGERVPTLTQALNALPSARFNLDIKSADAVWPAAAAIRAADARDRVLIASFSERRRRAVVQQFPGIASSASWLSAAAAIIAAKLHLQALVNWLLRDVDAVQVPTRAGIIEILTPTVQRALDEAGVEMHFWTINEPAEMRRLLGLGVDAIISDRIDLLVALQPRR